MKIVKPSYEIFKLPDATDTEGVMSLLERIGRVCYKSEDKITPESAKKYLSMLKERRHWAMLEHYIFVLEVPIWIYNNVYDVLINHGVSIDYPIDPKYADKISFLRTSSYCDENGLCHYIVSASATTLNYIYESNEFSDGLNEISNFLASLYPDLINSDNGTYDKNIKLLSREEIANLPIEHRLIHDSMTVKFTASRGFTHELVRHRPASFAQESTRYCTYSKEKFGSQITLIEPIIDESKMSDFYTIWAKAMLRAEDAYLELINAGFKAQDARAVLPNSLKAEIVMTARLCEWKHVFNMRADKAAHPEMKQLMYPLLKDTIDSYDCFNDLQKRLEEGIEDGWV